MNKLKIFSLASLFLFALMTLLAIYLAEAALHPKRKLLDTKSQGVAESIAQENDAKVLNVEITSSDGTFLKAWFFDHPNNDRRAVILLHGQADNRSGMIEYAKIFLSHQFSVLVPDARAHGLSGGSFATYGLMEADDVHHWLGWLFENRGIKQVYGLGESMGAAILLQSLDRETRFSAVVAESSFSNFREIAYDRVGSFFSTGSWLGRTIFRPVLGLAYIYSHVRYGIDFNLISPEKSVARSDIPILLIHCVEDRNIPIRHSRKIAVQSSPNVVLWEVSGGTHSGALGSHRLEFEKRVISLFGLSALQMFQ